MHDGFSFFAISWYFLWAVLALPLPRHPEQMKIEISVSSFSKWRHATLRKNVYENPYLTLRLTCRTEKVTGRFVKIATATDTALEHSL